MLPTLWAILPTVGEALFAAHDLEAFHAVKPMTLSSDALPLDSPSPAVAVLPIQGVILPCRSAFATLLGASCLDQLTADFCAARDNPAIQAIVLAIDSPGGLLTGVHAFSELVFDARPLKPIIALVSGLAASAAYWIAAAASQIWVDPTASVGSIGVMATVQDTQERDKKAGIARLTVISSQSPYKQPDGRTEAGRAQCQAHVDALADVFIEAVARYRKVSLEAVLSDFGQGGLVVGQAAVTQGLADKVQTFPALFTHLIKVIGEAPMSMQATTPALPSSPEAEVSAEAQALSFEASMPLDHAFAAGRALGITEERARIQAIEAQGLPGQEALIQHLKFEEACSAQAAAVQILAAEKVKHEVLHKALLAEAPSPLPPLRGEDSLERPLSLAEQCQREWENSAALQAEFPEAAIYVAYRQAKVSGLIKPSLKVEI